MMTRLPKQAVLRQQLPGCSSQVSKHKVVSRDLSCKRAVKGCLSSRLPKLGLDSPPDRQKPSCRSFARELARASPSTPKSTTSQSMDPD